jgi:hypothetical protein
MGRQPKQDEPEDLPVNKLRSFRVKGKEWNLSCFYPRLFIIAAKDSARKSHHEFLVWLPEFLLSN